LANIKLQLSKGLLWIPTVDPFTIPNFVSVIFKVRAAFSSTVFLVHKGTDNTISILGGYVYDNENNIVCGLRLVRLLLRLGLGRQNKLILRHSSTTLIDVANLIHHHTYQGEF
jgi:hypothetical protein